MEFRPRVNAYQYPQKTPQLSQSPNTKVSSSIPKEGYSLVSHDQYDDETIAEKRPTEVQNVSKNSNKDALNSKITLTLEELEPYYTATKLSLGEELLFQGTLGFNKIMTFVCSKNEPELSTWNPHDEVVDGIYLGRILEKENNPIPDDVGLIVSVCKYGELASIKFPFHDFIKNGGKHILIHMVDFGSQVSSHCVIEALKTMHDFLNSSTTERNKIYVHCKAGASRSASVVAAYHAYANDLSLEESIKKLEEKRVQVSVGPEKKETFKRILKLAKTSQEDVFAEPLQLNPTHSLASLEAKNRIRHLPSFKKLALYAATFEGTNRATYVQGFIKSIFASKDAGWYINLNLEGCLLKKLVNAKPRFDSYLGFDDKLYRESLVHDFISELENLNKELST